MKDGKLISYEDVDTRQEYNIDKDSQSGLSIDRRTSLNPETSSNPSFSTNIGESIAKYREENPLPAVSSESAATTSNNRNSSIYTDTILKGSLTGRENIEKAFDEYFSKHPEQVEYREFLTRIMGPESSFQNVQNSEGYPAYGYFQLDQRNLQGHSPEEVMEDLQLQIKLAIDLDRSNLATFTPEDIAVAKKLGYNTNALRFASWLAGPGSKKEKTGVKGYLYYGINPSDSHHYKDKKRGKSAKDYLDIGNYKDGGAVNTKRFPVKISGKTYNIKIAETEEDKSVGLSEEDTLPKDGGMLFMISEEDKDKEGLVWFTMEDTKIPLDIIFIDDNFEVLQVSKGEPLSEEPIYGKGSYVLEVNSDSKIIVGDELEFETSKKINNKMMVLDVEGNAQMTLDGGERIFSIKNTKILIKFAKKSTATKKDNDYKALGKRVFKFLEIQDSNEAEYV